MRGEEILGNSTITSFFYFGLGYSRIGRFYSGWITVELDNSTQVGFQYM